MKRVWKLMLMVLMAVSALMSYAFADVAVGPMYAAFLGVPVLAIAIIVIVLVLILRSVRRAGGRKSGAPGPAPRKPGGSPGEKDADSGRIDWRNKDPWDIHRE